MNLNWKDTGIIAGVVLAMVVIGLIVYNTGSKMLASKKTTPELKS